MVKLHVHFSSLPQWDKLNSEQEELLPFCDSTAVITATGSIYWGKWKEMKLYSPAKEEESSGQLPQ